MHPSVLFFFSFWPSRSAKNPGGVVKILHSCSSPTCFITVNNNILPNVNAPPLTHEPIHPLKHFTTSYAPSTYLAAARKRSFKRSLLSWTWHSRLARAASGSRDSRATLLSLPTRTLCYVANERNNRSRCSYVALHVRAALGRDWDFWQRLWGLRRTLNLPTTLRSFQKKATLNAPRVHTRLQSCPVRNNKPFSLASPCKDRFHPGPLTISGKICLAHTYPTLSLLGNVSFNDN